MVGLQKIEEELKTKIKEAGVENKVLREKNEALAKKVELSKLLCMTLYFTLLLIVYVDTFILLLFIQQY